MSTKTILSRGYQALRQSVALGSFQSDARGGLACPRLYTTWNWPGVGELDARQLRDIGLPAEAAALAAVPQPHHDLAPIGCRSIQPLFGFSAGL